ncbi:MAG TPA: 4Fe-4S dicluster domain-containing protein [Candidatus Krumholzibacteria bacterium]|nr:4Fe-4S dicluster domain-containing protein [Candidatus Krumholzibacteria bacterium]HPD73206.1 4Fe-4S dicluster domain-containing protein [Candidatus Krumholzibacteria bacterium]HRY40168.1 4Fe-4S dicluster domain-containing protein [Candidatus Krumholzibacteria bacterium]
MSETRILNRAALGELIAALTAAGQRVLAPVEDDGRVEFREVTDADRLALDYVQTVTSAKAVVFPRFERMLRFAMRGKDVTVEEVPPASPPTVLLGAHPCDAASFATLRAVFTWDSGDAYCEPKLAALTVVGLSCARGDDFCFCTSVGGGPADARGCDILLSALDEKTYRAEILTERGRALVDLAPGAFQPGAGAKPRPVAAILPRFAAAELTEKLPELFGDASVWRQQSLRCLGCGSCAYVCPTCTCFDIQDERSRYDAMRVRTWDACGFGHFTLHASGHNPRGKQSERWRQRVMHKFAYQPARLQVLGCVGCGRCSRSCPVDMNLGEHLERLAATAAGSE